jgi:hypothetical protein
MTYIDKLIKDYRTLCAKSFLDKHGALAVKIAKKASEKRKHEQSIDNQTRFN